MSGELLGGLMLLAMIGAIFIGFPISFTLLFLAFTFGFVGFPMAQVVYLADTQIFDLMKSEILPAVPLFIFMGYMTEQAGLMERLFVAFRTILERLPGALYLAVILTATVFAMATGIVGAAVAVLGIMAAPIMMKAGYDHRMSAGAIAAGGTLGILIPPSVMLVVMGPVIGVPVNKLYAAAFGPGFLLATMYIVYTLTRSFLNPKLGPPVPVEERTYGIASKLREVAVGMLPLAILIGFTLGSILAGWATPSQAAACGALGACILALVYGKLTWKALRNAAMSTTLTSAMVLFLALASNVFGSLFAKFGTATVITNTLVALPVAPVVVLIIVMALIFLLGWPFEWPAIILVFLPIFYPVIEKLQLFDLSRQDKMIWFGALVAVNLQTAFLSPPVAMSAYYLKQVAPQWSLNTIYRGMADFMVIQCIALLLVVFFPQIALFLVDYL